MSLLNERAKDKSLLLPSDELVNTQTKTIMAAEKQ